MKSIVPGLAAAALLTMGGAAHAQEAPPPATTPAPAAPAPAPAEPAPQSFTDSDLRAFAFAAIETDKIAKDASIAATEKQARMLAAVEAQGLDPAKYNAIAQAAQADPELVRKIQAAAATGTP